MSEEQEKVYITANPTPNPECIKFIVDRDLVHGSPVTMASAEAAKGSPLAEKLFSVPQVDQIFAYQNFVTITKKGEVVWQEFAKAIGQTIREHIWSKEAHFDETALKQGQEDSEEVRTIKAVLDEIRPMVAMDGGNIVFAGYQDHVVQVYMQGSCAGCPSSTLTLKAGIETRIKEVLPQVREVVAI